MLLYFVALALVPTVLSGDFRLSSTLDQINDTRSNMATIGTQKNYLAIGCDAGGPRIGILIHSDEYLGEALAGLLAGGRRVDYRFEQDRPLWGMWTYAGHDVIQAGGPTVRGFIKRLRTARTLFIRVFDSSGAPVEFRINYNDPSSILDEVENRCAAAGKSAR